MAERNVGSVKQVIRCLLMEREMGKESWPSVLPEASFFLNNVKNSTTKISPHMLTYGRQPRTPTDLWAETREMSGGSSPLEYLESLQERQESLTEEVITNEARSFESIKQRYDRGKRDTSIAPGDKVLLERGKKQDSLTTKFEGPYTVTGQRGANIQLDLPGGRKWYHANRCKRLEGKESWLAQTKDPVTIDGNVNEDSLETGFGGEPDEIGGENQEPTPQEAETEITYSRYGRRHKPPKHPDFIPWSQIPEEDMTQDQSFDSFVGDD